MIQILVVDDSETFRNTLVNDLSEFGYQVDQARDGLEAIQKITSGNPHSLIIMDINMPGANGLEVLEKCQEQILKAKSVIFMLTTDSSIELKTKGKELGVRAWITKPYNKDSLQMAIKKVFSL
jgi:CheY-like chemotaxis protein